MTRDEQYRLLTQEECCVGDEGHDFHLDDAVDGTFWHECPRCHLVRITRRSRWLADDVDYDDARVDYSRIQFHAAPPAAPTEGAKP